MFGLCLGLVGIASPCGMCRQFIREFCGLDMPILMFDVDGGRVIRTLGEVRDPLDDDAQPVQFINMMEIGKVGK